MALNAVHSDKPHASLPPNHRFIIDKSGETRTQITQKIHLMCEAPVGKKYFFKVLKQVVGLVTLECHFKLKLSDKHFMSTSAALYQGLMNTHSIQYLPATQLTGKRSLISCDIFLIPEYPSFPVTASRLRIKREHYVTLIKKGTAKGTLTYSFIYETNWYNQAPLNNALCVNPDAVILERVSTSRVQKLVKYIKFKVHHQKFNLRRVLEEIDIHASIEFQSYQSVDNFEDWYEPHHALAEEAAGSKSLLEKSLVPFHKGLKKLKSK